MGFSNYYTYSLVRLLYGVKHLVGAAHSVNKARPI